MEHEVIWIPWDRPGTEHLHLAMREGGIVADSLIIGVVGDRVFRVRYQIQCDPGWRARYVRITMLAPGESELILRSDGEGHWTTSAETSMLALDGCMDVDISASPFTNSLPIRRLRLAPGESVDLPVVYIDVPALRVSVERQRYSCLELGQQAARYRFEALAGGFRAELTVDTYGLVVDYHQLFRRVWTSNSG